MMNMYWEKLDFEIPVLPNRMWFKVLDTAEPSPHDIVDPGNEVEVDGSVCPVQGRSIVVLVSK
jgi:glycogen operon protein